MGENGRNVTFFFGVNNKKFGYIIRHSSKSITWLKWGDIMLTNTMKEDLIHGLVDIFSDNILAVILYGSVARNENTDESDIDIAIIIRNEMDDATKERFIRWSAELDLRYDRVFSIIDIQEENMEKWGKVLPFYQNVQKEGIVLWKAA